MICHRQGLENKNTNTNKDKDKYIQQQIQEQPTDLCCYMFFERRWQNESGYEENAENAEYLECADYAEYAEYCFLAERPKI